MHSQELDKVIAIDHLVVTKGTSGGQNRQWLPLYSRKWARVSHEGGGEQDATSKGGRTGTDTAKFRIHACAGLEDPTTLRIRFKGRIYNATHINPIFERGEWLMITATTGQNNG